MRSVAKRIIYLFLILLIVQPLRAQNWLWAKSSNSGGSGEGNGVDKDQSGNIFVCGSFQSSIIAFGTNTLTLTGNSNAFLVKYDPLGNVLWARSSTGSVVCNPTALKTDLNGNVLVTGFFSSSIVFGTQTLTSISSYDVFLAKYDANGNVLWAKSGGGASLDWGLAVATDPSGNSYITGYTTSTLTVWDSFSLTVSVPINSNNGFLIKYDPGGNVLWARQGTCSGWNSGTGVSCDNTGYIFMAGFSTGSIAFGTVTIAPTGGRDSYLVKFDALGNAIWAAGGISCAGDDYGAAVSIDAAGIVT